MEDGDENKKPNDDELFVRDKALLKIELQKNAEHKEFRAKAN